MSTQFGGTPHTQYLTAFKPEVLRGEANATSLYAYDSARRLVGAAILD